MAYSISLLLVYLFNILSLSTIYGIHSTIKAFSFLRYDYIVYGNPYASDYVQLKLQPVLIYSYYGIADIYNNYPPYNSGFALDINGNNYYYAIQNNDSYTQPLENGQWAIVKSSDSSLSWIFDNVYNFDQELSYLLKTGYVCISFSIVHFFSILNFYETCKPKKGKPYKSQIVTLIYLLTVIIMTLSSIHSIHGVLRLVMNNSHDSTYGSIWIILVFCATCQIILFVSIIIAIIKCKINNEPLGYYTLWHFPILTNFMDRKNVNYAGNSGYSRMTDTVQVHGIINVTTGEIYVVGKI